VQLNEQYDRHFRRQQRFLLFIRQLELTQER